MEHLTPEQIRMLQDLKGLRDSGVLTAEEFQKNVDALLGRVDSPLVSMENAVGSKKFNVLAMLPRMKIAAVVFALVLLIVTVIILRMTTTNDASAPVTTIAVTTTIPVTTTSVQPNNPSNTAVPVATAPKTTTTTKRVYEIGETGPGGGIVFITPSTTGNATGKYFEVDVSALLLMPWAEIFPSTVWPQFSAIIGGGLENTRRMSSLQFKSCEELGEDYYDIFAPWGTTPAESRPCGEGEFAANYFSTHFFVGGYSDWFLPSKEELNQIYLNLVDKNFRDNFVGYFDSSANAFRHPFFSSSEYSGYGVWCQNFDTGAVGANAGGPGCSYWNSAYVLPVRAFSL